MPVVPTTTETLQRLSRARNACRGLLEAFRAPDIYGGMEVSIGPAADSLDSGPYRGTGRSAEGSS